MIYLLHTVLLLLLLVIPKPTMAATQDVPITKKVMVLNFDPILEQHGNLRLTHYKLWGDPHTLQNNYIQSVEIASHGYLNYRIVENHDIDDIPTKYDGFDYSDESYLSCIATPSLCHPDTGQGITANYNSILATYGACEKRNAGAIDEVWLWGGPYFGYWESTLTGPGAFWYNSSPIGGTTCQKLLPIMGFSYERAEAEMLHNLSHRAEAVMTHIYGGWRYGYGTPPVSVTLDTPWDRFSARSVHTPATGVIPGCGNTHLPFNSLLTTGGGDYARNVSVATLCDDFLHYPQLTNIPIEHSCTAWDCTQDGYMRYWFFHMPHASGSTEGIRNNWWQYISNYEFAISTLPTLSGDISADGIVNAYDVQELGHLVSGVSSIHGDTNGDTLVDIFDYGIVIKHFGERSL